MSAFVDQIFFLLLDYISRNLQLSGLRIQYLNQHENTLTQCHILLVLKVKHLTNHTMPHSMHVIFCTPSSHVSEPPGALNGVQQ